MLSWHIYFCLCHVNARASSIPPAWDYNPSTWGERIPLVVIGFAGFCIAMYLSMFQMNVFDTVWDPFFGEGTEKILTSRVSQAFPIPDALLGAFGYFVDVVTGLIGGTDRWRTKPWIVILFGAAVGPLGLVSVFLVIAQPVLVGYWCTLCLCSAVIFGGDDRPRYGRDAGQPPIPAAHPSPAAFRLEGFLGHAAASCLKFLT